MKWLILAMAFVQTTGANPPHSAVKPSASSSNVKQNPDNQNTNPAPAPPIQNKENSPSQKENGNDVGQENKPNHVIIDHLPDKDNWDRAAILLTGLLVVVGGATLGAIWYQSLQTKIAAEAMQKSIGVTYEIERARLLSYWDQIIHINLSPSGEHNGQFEHWFNWSFVNSGRTHAELTGTWARFMVIDKLSDLPEKPDYSQGKEIAYIGEQLEPEGKSRQTQWFATKLETTLPFEEMQDLHRSGKCLLYAYGYGRYKDVWGNARMMRFGVVRFIRYSLMEDTWVVDGPPEYNRQT